MPWASMKFCSRYEDAVSRRLLCHRNNPLSLRRVRRSTSEAILHAMLTLVRRPDREGVRRRPFDRKRGDSLLFGNLFNMSCDDDTRMKEMMNDSEYLYESLIGDIYVPGQVLGRNYRLLLQNYILFMYEIILCP